MKTLQVPFNLRVSGMVSWQKRSRWNCMYHDAGVLAYTLASWQRFRETAPISVTTHEFIMKVLRRDRKQQLKCPLSLRDVYDSSLHREQQSLHCHFCQHFYCHCEASSKPWQSDTLRAGDCHVAIASRNDRKLTSVLFS